MSLSSSSLTLACCFVLAIFFFQSSLTYVIDSNDLTNYLIDQEFGLNIPSYFYDRNIRATKFPRIGRSSTNSEEFDLLADSNSEENVNDDLVEERSVFFPRIGKRAFHNLLWANSRSNPHRMLDSQGRYYLNGYDYHVHHVRPSGLTRYRVKRSVSM